MRSEVLRHLGSVPRIAFQACSLTGRTHKDQAEQPASLERNAAVQEAAAQRTDFSSNRTTVRSTEWVADFCRLESATWRWWPRFVPDGTACSLGSNWLERSRTQHNRPAQRFTLFLTSLLSAVMGEPHFHEWNHTHGSERMRTTGSRRNPYAISRPCGWFDR
jgi:hypothetical protein